MWIVGRFQVDPASDADAVGLHQVIHELAGKGAVLVEVKLYGQGDLNRPACAGVFALFISFYAVPEHCRISWRTVAVKGAQVDDRVLGAVNDLVVCLAGALFVYLGVRGIGRGFACALSLAAFYG